MHAKQEKDDVIMRLQTELNECKNQMDKVVKEEGEIKEMPEIKVEIEALKTHVQEGMRAWNEVVKANEDAKWIEVAKNHTPQPEKSVNERRDPYMCASRDGRKMMTIIRMPKNYAK